jgi:hypothetical protein
MNFPIALLKHIRFPMLLLSVITLILSGKSQNLILNPGCEDTLVNGEIPYWTEVIGNNWTQRTASPDPYEGSAYFFPGVAAAAELQQDVDISAYKSTIDDSSQSFLFEGYVRAYPQSPADQSRIILEFLDSLKTTKIDSFDSGNYSNTTEWVQLTDTTLAPPETRYIRIRLVSTRRAGSNNDGYYDGLSLEPFMPVRIYHKKNNLPKSLVLLQNYPNPFNSTTKIEFLIPNNEFVTLKIYNLLGEEVAALLSDQLPPGSYQYEWDASPYPTGLYIYKLTAGRTVELKKLLFIK